MNQEKILISIATYNEVENIPIIYREIKKSVNADILFIDDNSPDGTGAKIDEIIKDDPSIHVLHRAGKLGTGTAFIEAFKFANAHNYDLLVTMDADLTHDPKYLPSMIEKQDHADIVIGSRYAEGGKMSGWNTIRLPLTHFWRNLIKYGLDMPFDATGAFRVYKVPVLKEEVYKKIASKGFSFQMESIFTFKQHGARIAEVPIHARSRIHGESKLDVKIMKEVFCNFFRLLCRRIFK